MTLKWLNDSLTWLMRLERRVDPFFRPGFDALFQAPLAAATQAVANLLRPPPPDLPACEIPLPDETALMDAIIAAMAAYMHTHYLPGGYQRAGNTKTHGIVRGRFTVHDGLPPELRHGLFAQPGEYPAWVRFAGPGPESPPDIDDVGVLSIGIKVMGVDGPKLLQDEQFTQDFTGISTPTFTTPNLRENIKLQQAIGSGVPLLYFLTHPVDAIMQGLWARTQTSPLETSYWGCAPYLLGEGQAMRYSLRPRATTRSKVPNLPGRPPENYLREAMARTLTQREVVLDFLIQRQTQPSCMPIEDASILWPERLSPYVIAASLTLPKQEFNSPAQLAFANVLSINPWHSLGAHRPLGNQNRGRLRIYQELSRLRQAMNDTPHVEPTGQEQF